MSSRSTLLKEVASSEFTGLAVGVGGRGAAHLAPEGEAAVDAVAAGIAGDDEHAPFRLRAAGYRGMRQRAALGPRPEVSAWDRPLCWRHPPGR